MSCMLASVTSVEEAMLVMEAGADIIDLKNPAQGALGALPGATVQAVVAAIQGRRQLSATIGDLPMQPHMVLAAAETMSNTGVDIVKIGLFPDDQPHACITAISSLAQRQKIVTVLFADASPDFDLLPVLAHAGVYGVMLDTAYKNGKRLTDYLPVDMLQQFVEAAHRLGLMAGLAGSLRACDINVLAPLEADYLGFRGALCDKHDRQAGLNKAAVRQITQLLRQDNKDSIRAPCSII